MASYWENRVMFFSCRGDFLRRKNQSMYHMGILILASTAICKKGSSYYSQEGTQTFPENYRDLKQPQQNLCQPDLLSRHTFLAVSPADLITALGRRLFGEERRIISETRRSCSLLFRTANTLFLALSRKCAGILQQ